jgi:hypothetical protein
LFQSLGERAMTGAVGSGAGPDGAGAVGRFTRAWSSTLRLPIRSAQSESLNCANDPTTLEVCVRATWASAASGTERNDKGAAFPPYD